jgi:fibronectin-binding autotransporter adhesin
MRRLLILATFALATSALLATPALAQTYTWKTSGFVNNQMSNGNNWVGNVAPPSGDPNLKLVLSGTNGFALQDIASPPLVLQDLDITGYFQMFGNALQFDNLGANPTLTATNYVELQTPVSFVDPATISVANFSQLNLIGALTGSSLTFNGAGNSNVNITGAGSALTGTNTINSGVSVNVQTAGAIGGTLNVAGGSLIVQAGGVFASGADVNISGGGQVYTNGGANTIDDLDVSGGSMVLQGNLTIAGAITSSSGANVVGQSTGTISLPTNASISVTSTGTDYLNISGPIATGSFTKTGAGKLELGTFGTNTFSGTNTVSAGTLRGSSGAIGTVLNNATVELNGGTVTAGQITGTGDVVITAIVDYAAFQTYGGTTTINGGSLSAEVTTIPALVTGVGGGGGVTFEDVGNVTHTGTIAGNLAVSKSGAGVLTLSGNNPYTIGTFVGSGGGGFAIGSDTAIGTGQLGLFDSANTLEAIGSRTLSNALFVGNGATFQGAGSFNFTDTTAKLLNGPLVHNSTGTTIIAGKHAVNPSASITVNSGTLALGDNAVVNGFTSAGPVTVNGGMLSLNSLNFINLPTVTLAGGTLNVPNGYAIPLGAVLTGNGGVTGRLATANGSTIIASGNLVLGDAAHPAGVNLDGELYTNNNTVTLQDSNQAVLGSITDLGTATLDGTLVAPNGAVLNFGRNLIGRGQIQSNNTLADAVIVNGDVNGDAISTPLVFTGYVKGVGTFNNVAFSGTFSPGLSPTLLTVGNTVLLPTNILQMEIGGLNRGSQHDAFDVLPASTMVLDGNMQVSLINAFNPSLGDQFNLFDGTTSGVFSSFSFPALNPGLTWDTSLLYTSGILQVVAIPEPATLSMALLVGAALLKRRRR